MRIIVVFSLVLVGCKTIKPELPAIKKSIAPPPKIIVSALSIPIEIDLTSGLKEVELSVPKTFKGFDQPCSGLGYSYIFERNPINYEFKDGEVSFVVSGGLGLDVNYCPGCHSLFGEERCVVPRVYGSCGSNGESKRRMETQFKTKIDLNKKYQLVSSTKLNYVKLIDPCRFSFMKINVTKEIENTVSSELSKQETEIDKQITSFSLRPQLEKIWEDIQQPIDLYNYGFLYLQPKTVAFDKINFNNHSVSTRLQLTLSPQVLTSKNLKNKQLPLPDASTMFPLNKFGIYIDVLASYDSLNNYINNSMGGASIEIKNKRFIIDSASLFQIDLDTVGINVSFSGFKKGVLYFKGVPKLDSLTQTFCFKELSYTLDTKSALLNTAKWLYNDAILEFIENNSCFSMTETIGLIKNTISSNFNQEINNNVFLEGKLIEFSPKELFIQEQSVLLRCLLSADLKLKIK